jgi:outer membrane protein TolC
MMVLALSTVAFAAMPAQAEEAKQSSSPIVAAGAAEAAIASPKVVPPNLLQLPTEPVALPRSVFQQAAATQSLTTPLITADAAAPAPRRNAMNPLVLAQAPAAPAKPVAAPSVTTPSATTPSITTPSVTTPSVTTPLPPSQLPAPTAVPSLMPPSLTPAPKPGAAPTVADALKLNPDPNPLQFPTQTAEVTLKGAQPLGLDQAIALAERNSRPIEQAKLQMERSRAALREAQAALLPTVTAQGDITRSKSADVEISGRQTLKNLDRDLQSADFGTRLQAQQTEAQTRASLEDADDARTRVNASVGVRYDLITSGRRPNQIRAAERQLRLSELEVDRVSAQTRFDVADTYYQLQEAEQQIETSNAAITSAKANLKQVKLQVEVGVGTRFDELRANVQLANNQQQLSSALANREILRRRLAQRLSLPESVIVVPNEAPKRGAEWPLSLEQTIILAYKNRAELEQQLVQREISEARRKVALSALGPTVSLVAQLNFLESLDDSVGVGSGYAIAGQFQWSLFDGGAAKAQAAQQVKDREIAESRFAEQRGLVRFEVEQAYATLRSNQENIETTKQALEQSIEASRLAQLRFDNGVGTQTEVLDAQADETRARSNATTAVIGYNRSLAQLRRAVSNLPQNLAQIVRSAPK